MQGHLLQPRRVVPRDAWARSRAGVPRIARRNGGVVSADLTAEEVKNARTAIRFLKTRCGVKNLAKALRVEPSTLNAPPSPTTVFRVAKLVGVGVDDVLTGKYPPEGACPHCGNVPRRESLP
jgi:hypothetical protein